MEKIVKYFSYATKEVMIQFLFGSIVASVVIYSVLQLFKNLQILISRLEHAILFEIVGFSILITVGVFIILLIFNKVKIRMVSIVKAPQVSQIVDGSFSPKSIVVTVSVRFLEGFLFAFQENSRKNNSKQRHLQW